MKDESQFKSDDESTTAIFGAIIAQLLAGECQDGDHGKRGEKEKDWLALTDNIKRTGHIALEIDPSTAVACEVGR